MARRDRLETKVAASRDTIVVPVRPKSFARLILGERRWYPIRVSDATVPSLRTLATYFPAPKSSITHIVSVVSIEPFQGPYDDQRDWAKKVIILGDDVREIRNVPSGTRVKSIQSLRYANLEELINATSLDDLW